MFINHKWKIVRCWSLTSNQANIHLKIITLNYSLVDKIYKYYVLNCIHLWLTFLKGKMMSDLADITDQLETWKEGKGVILHGHGDAFCSGGFYL